MIVVRFHPPVLRRGDFLNPIHEANKMLQYSAIINHGRISSISCLSVYDPAPNPHITVVDGKERSFAIFFCRKFG